ncbi:MAG: DUF4955 domain-containing protein [Planctomycetota bacterium]
MPTVDERYRVLDIEDFGGVPNDGKSDRAAIVSAIAAADEIDGPVVIRFPAGRFVARAEEDFMAPPIEIGRSDLVIRGAGSNPGGTEIYLASPSNSFAFEIKPKGVKRHWRGDRLAGITEFGPIGTFSVEVDEADELEPDMVVTIMSFLPDDENAPEVKKYFAPHTPMPEGIAHTKNRPWRTLLKEMHQIDRIEGRRVYFHEPIYHEGHEIGLKEGYLARFTPDREPMLTEIGIEDIAFTTAYEELYSHYFTQASDGYHVIKYESVMNCWVRNLRFRGYTYAISLNGSIGNTFRDILLEGNAGHLPISVQESYGTLISHVREFTDSHHGLGTTNNSSNTVYHRCVQYGSLEAHCKYPRATLHDRGDGMFAMTRPGGATFTPHHGKRLVFWNWNNIEGFVPPHTVLPKHDQKDFWPIGSRYGYFLPPSIIGLHGKAVSIPDRATDVAIFESYGDKVDPESLFEAQLTRRLGSLPDEIRAASERFEATQRYTRAEFAHPADNVSVDLGRPMRIEPQFHDAMDPAAVEKVVLVGSRSPRVFDAEPLLEMDGTRPGQWRPEEPGVWMLWLQVHDVNGVVTTSRPVHVLVRAGGSADRSTTFYKAAEAWYQPESLMPPTRMKIRGEAISAFEKSNNLQRYRDDVHQAGHRSVVSMIDAESGAGALIDGKAGTSFRADQGYEPSAVVIDLGESRKVDTLRLRFPDRLGAGARIGMEVQVSDDADAVYSYSNDDRLWREGMRRMGSGRTTERLRPGRQDALIYFPAVEGRYVRLVIHTLSPHTLSEVQLGYSHAE